MKFKIFLVLILGVLLTTASYSQVKLAIGPEVGINIANFTTTPDISTSTRTGMIFGADLDVGFGHYISIQPGLRFVMKGASGNDGAGGTVTDKLNYFEIPVLLKVTFPLTEVKPFLIAGPILGINMSANADDTPQGGNGTSTDISSSISGTDFNLLIGGGVGFKIAPKIDLYGQFGYAFGLSNILKNATTQTFKTTGLQITAGAWFHL